MIDKPAYGVGLAYRPEVQKDFFRLQDIIDVIEIPSISYIYRRNYITFDPQFSLIREALSVFPATSHGINLSVGSVEPVDMNILKSTKSFLQKFQVKVFSDHCTFHKMGKTNVKSFLCMPFTEQSAQLVAEKYNYIRNYLGHSFGLENVSYDFSVKMELSEVEFISRVCELTDCHLLLDATNLYNNSQNFKYDPFEFIEKLPLDRVYQIHLAGGYYSEGKWWDTHNKKVMAGVWPIYEALLEKTKAEIVIIERDSDLRNLTVVEDDLLKARELFYKYRKPNKAKNWITNCQKEPKPVDLSKYEDLRKFQQLVIDMLVAEQPQDYFHVLYKKYALEPQWRDLFLNLNQEDLKSILYKVEGVTKLPEMELKSYRWFEWRQWLQQSQRR